MPANSLARSIAARFACQKRRACSQSKEVANNWAMVFLIAVILQICRTVLLELTKSIQMTHFRASHDTQQAISEFQKLSLSKRGKVQKLCCENEFNLYEGKNHFHVNGFVLSLALNQRLEATRKWPIEHFTATGKSHVVD